MLHESAGTGAGVVVEGRQFLGEDEGLFVEGTVALGAEAEAVAQRLTPIVEETSVLER